MPENKPAGGESALAKAAHWLCRIGWHRWTYSMTGGIGPFLTIVKETRRCRCCQKSEERLFDALNCHPTGWTEARASLAEGGKGEGNETL